MFFAWPKSVLIVSLIALNAVLSAPVLDGSASVDNYNAGDYLKVAPENANGRESAILETEGKISSIMSVYDDKQNKVADFLNAPIEATKSISKQITKQLDRLGGKIVGLA